MENKKNVIKKEMNNDVLINRKILGWEWYKDVNTYKLFTHLIYKANYENGEHRGVLVKRGQVYTGLDKLKFETGLSVTNIRTSIKRLILTNNITSKSTNKYRIITVLKYDAYQLANNQANKQPDKLHAIQLAASNKDKELLKEIKQLKQIIKDMKTPKPKKQFIIPTVKELENYCKERNNTVNPNKFFDFYESKGWVVGKTKMKNWKAAVRTWENDNPKKDNDQSLDEILGINGYEKR